MPSSLPPSFFIYILRCSDNSLYVVHSANLQERVKAHNVGKTAAWTACRRPIVLVYSEQAENEQEAIRRELQLKRWMHAKKQALIEGDLAQLKTLAKRRVR